MSLYYSRKAVFQECSKENSLDASSVFWPKLWSFCHFAILYLVEQEERKAWPHMFPKVWWVEGTHNRSVAFGWAIVPSEQDGGPCATSLQVHPAKSNESIQTSLPDDSGPYSLWWQCEPATVLWPPLLVESSVALGNKYLQFISWVRAQAMWVELYLPSWHRAGDRFY